MPRINHTKKLALQERRARVSRMLAEGMNQIEIARALHSEGLFGSLASAQVSVVQDVKVIKEEWKQSSLQDYDELKGRAYEKYEWIFHELRQAWERSKGQSNSVTVQQYKSPDNEGKTLLKRSRDEEDSEEKLKNDRVISTVRKEARDGNPVFTAQMMQCVEQQCELMGLRVKPGEVGTAPPIVSFRIHSPSGESREVSSNGSGANGSSPTANGESQSA